MDCNIGRNYIFSSLLKPGDDPTPTPTPLCRFPHLIEAVIEEHNLRLLAAGTLAHQHVARVGVTVHEAVHEDHLAVHLAQVL